MADLAGPAAIVEDKYSKSSSLADAAVTAVNGFQDALNRSVYSPPTFSLQWNTVATPALTSIPPPPANEPLTLNFPASVPSGMDVGALGTSVGISGDAPTPPSMNFGAAPTLTIGTTPSLPTLRDVPVPEAPEVELPDAPDFLALTTHSFGGVNLREDWLDKLDDIPELSILQPAPFHYSPGARYASQLLDNLKARLNARIQGGTGLSPEVEQALWGRALDRETALALAREKEVLRGAEALGFPLPSGVLIGQLADARREYHDKLSGLSRDITIKQAELEQQNLKDTVQAALQLETTLLDDTYKLEMLAYEASKTAAENAISAYNAALEHFKALLDGYRTYAAAYDTVVKAEMSKVEVFKAMLSAEQLKADINRSLVERYKAEIEGRMAGVEIFKARVGAAKTLMELEQLRIQAGGEQIRAFVATINAEMAKVDIYKSQVQAESVKHAAYSSQVQAYSANVGAQAEMARVEVARIQARVAAKTLEWDGYKAQVSAESARVEATARVSGLQADAYRMAAAAAQAQAGANMRKWEADIKQYEAGMNHTLQTAKVNADAAIHANDARMEAAKVGLTTASQRLASAWSMVSASATISGTSSDTLVRSA